MNTKASSPLPLNPDAIKHTAFFTIYIVLSVRGVPETTVVEQAIKPELCEKFLMFLKEIHVKGIASRKR